MRPHPAVRRFSKAFNLVTRLCHSPTRSGFLSDSGRLRSQPVFAIPWNGRTLIGTRHAPL